MQQEAQAAQDREARNVNAQQPKYEKVWAHAAYRTVAPGEYHVERFIELARPGTGHVVADFGAGTGRAAAILALGHNLSVCAVDFASGCLDEGVRKHLGERFRFLQHDLAAPLNESFDFGFCTDVLEHVPTKDVATVVRNIINAADRVYFNISTQPDVMGALIGEPLHLTVRDPFWWHDLLRSLGFNISWSQYDDH